MRRWCPLSLAAYQFALPYSASLDGVLRHVRAAQCRATADDSWCVACGNRPIQDAAAALGAALDPPIVATARRLKAQPQAATLSLLGAARRDVVAAALEAAVQGPTPQRLLVSVELVLCRHARAVFLGSCLKVAHATKGTDADARCVVRWDLKAEQAATTLRGEGATSVLVPTTRRLCGASDATDFSRAEARREIHAINATSGIAAVNAPRGLREDLVLQCVARTFQCRSPHLLSARGIRDIFRHAFRWN
jgi:hypothetical protein